MAVNMSSVLTPLQSLVEVCTGNLEEFLSDIDRHMVWVDEVRQEGDRILSEDLDAELELMPKTSRKKSRRRKRVSLGHQEEIEQKFPKGRRGKLHGSSVKTLDVIAEEATVSEASTSEANATTTTRPKRTTRKNKQTKSEFVEDESQGPDGSYESQEVENKKPELVEEEEVDSEVTNADRLSAEHASSGRTAAKTAIAVTARKSRRRSVRHSLKLLHSLAGLRHSMTQESVRRASRRSMLKRKVAHTASSTCSSNADVVEECAQEEDREAMLETVTAEEEDNASGEESEETPETHMNQHPYPSVRRTTRSMAANLPTLAPPSLDSSKQTISTSSKTTVVTETQQTSKSGPRSRPNTKCRAPDAAEKSPTKTSYPPKKNPSAIGPNMRKNQLLMMPPNSLSCNAVKKSSIKHTFPLKVGPKLNIGVVTKERQKLEALKKKQELEEERMKKMEDERKRKQEELKRKRDERLRRVFEAKVKEEQREEEKKKKIEQKMAQIDEKNDKRQAEEKAKKRLAVKRQEELELKKKLEEGAKQKKIQQAEEKRQQQLLAQKKAEKEEQQARKLAEARRALELKREQERKKERELERERLAAERERVEKEKALALQRELERAAREKERRELEERSEALEEKRKMEEQQRLAAEEKAAQEREAAKQGEAAAKQPLVMSTPVGKGGGLNVTIDIEQQSPQSYSITPMGGNKPLLSKNIEDYGTDQSSDDSTDDESDPRKFIPSWAKSHNLRRVLRKHRFNPPDLDSLFGPVEPLELENIFCKSKPRYLTRTSSALWQSPPHGSK